MKFRTPTALASLLLILWQPTLACDFPTPPSLHVLAASAKHIYVFRLESAKVSERKRHGGVEGTTTPIATIAGATPKGRKLVYSVSHCGGHQLTVGNYYLAYLSSDKKVVTLVPGDESILDVSDYFGSSDPTAPGTQAFISEIRTAAEQKSLPPNFPHQAMRDRTEFYPSPPPPSPQ